MRDLVIALLTGSVYGTMLYHRVFDRAELLLFETCLVLVVKWAERHYGEEG